MTLEEFTAGNALSATLEYKSFACDISYAPNGSCAYFVLRNVSVRKGYSLSPLLNKYEKTFIFRVMPPLAPEQVDYLIERGYVFDCHGGYSLGLPYIQQQEEERKEREKKLLPKAKAPVSSERIRRNAVETKKAKRQKPL